MMGDAIDDAMEVVILLDTGTVAGLSLVKTQTRGLLSPWADMDFFFGGDGGMPWFRACWRTAALENANSLIFLVNNRSL